MVEFELFWQRFEFYFSFWCYTWHFQKSRILTCSLRNAIVGVSLVSYSFGLAFDFAVVVEVGGQ